MAIVAENNFRQPLAFLGFDAAQLYRADRGKSGAAEGSSATAELAIIHGLPWAIHSAFVPVKHATSIAST